MKGLTELAFQYGPFFFSLLFLVSISRWAYRNYNAASNRTNPAASAKEISTLRSTYLTSFAVGTVLVLASVMWWFLFRPQQFLFEGEIDSLEQYDNLQSSSEKVYFRSTYQLAPFYNRLSQTAYFVIVGNKPFSAGEGFDFNLYKGTVSETKITQDLNPLRVDYDPDDPSPTYTLDCCDERGRYTLKKAAPKPGGKRTSLIEGGVYAAFYTQDADPGVSRTSPSSNPKSSKVGAAAIIMNPSADIGERSLAISQLQSIENHAMLTRVFDDSQENAIGDPFVLTILDLTRHSDKQLAFRARSLLSNLNVNQYVADCLVSTDQAKRLSAERVLFRVDKGTASRIVELAKQKGWKSPSIEQDIESGKKTRVLVPTWLPPEAYHSAGDWYFVKAKWDPGDLTTQSCLTKVFHDSLISSRTLKQEEDLMKQKHGVRYVYWDEGWALAIADDIVKCGGQFAFVHPGE